jgi:hypothetical protein
MVFYIVLPNGLGPNVPYILIILGMVLVAFNYLDISTSRGSGLLHLVSNVFLVVGFLFVVLGLLEKTGNVVIGLFGVLISALWLDTRIHLSNWFHSLVCRNCRETCMAY